MSAFAHCFLLVFGQLALGGFWTLGLLPFHDIERGFYKSSAAVYVTSAFSIAAGELVLVTRGHVPASYGALAELAAWWIFTAAAGAYVASLWGDPYRRRALAYLATLVTGTIALATTALRFSPTPVLSLESLVYPATFLVSAVLLGATATGMLLGHWYLIDVGMPLAPFVRIWRVYRTSVLLQLAAIAACAFLLAVAGAPASVTALGRLWNDHQALLWTRLGLGPLPALGIAWMIGRTLAIPQTMAATGLFYVAVLTTVVGEMLGRFILYRTLLPL